MRNFKNFPHSDFFYFQLFLVVVYLMASASAADKNAGKAKVTALKNQKDPKEKRDAPASGPYSYEAPQKAFHSPAVHVQPPQPKHTHVEPYTQQHKVAPLEYIAKQEQQHEQYHPTSFVAPAQPQIQHQVQHVQHVENLFAQPIKEIEDFSLNYPQYDSFDQFPGYFGQYEKLIAVPVKPVSSLKTMPYYQAAQSYSYPQHSYPMATYAASIPAHYTSGFTQSPSSIFVPQTVSIASKPHGKIPDYAQSSKGLSHYSTFSSIQPVSSSYKQQATYDMPSYAFTQTERPFKASPFLGASVVPSESYKYEKQEYAPSKTYLPAKEQYVVPVKEQYGVPAKEQYTYVPQKEQYATAVKEQYVTPLKEHYNSYAPPKEQFYTPQVQKDYYQQYAPQAAPINYEIQYVQYPAGKSYLPPASSVNYIAPSTPIHSYPQAASPPTSSYLPPQKMIESPKNSYLPPPAAPTKSYLPPAKVEKPKNNYLPPSPPPTQSNTYLPPNNPFSSHQQSSQEIYDSSEYYSGHK